MGTTKKLKVLDLFSGIGGFSLGLERTGYFETVAFCEYEDYQKGVLRKHWGDEIPIYKDIKTLKLKEGIFDVVTGGFPCQPFSTASRGRKTAEDLWPEMARVVREVKPRYVIAENVQRKPIEVAASELSGFGYECEVLHIPAHEIGADHKRSRWWLLAHTHKDCEFQSTFNAEAQKLPKIRSGIWGAESYKRSILLSDGVSKRLALGAYGNAVCPSIVELLGGVINKMENLKAPPNE